MKRSDSKGGTVIEKVVYNSIIDKNYIGIVTVLDYETSVRKCLSNVLFNTQNRMERKVIVDLALKVGVNEYRFVVYDITDDGKILWNNIDLQNIDTDWLYSKIAYIPQNIVLFAGTMIDNITLFNNSYNFEKIQEVTKLVGIYDKIMSLPKSFDSLIGENGASLSGGEKQKIAIARALLKNPLLIIFDEATSNLDVFSEKQIVQIIKELHKKGLTIITIAHRLSTIRNADIIFFVDHGEIVERGNHEELLALNGDYAMMVNRQGK